MEDRTIKPFPGNPRKINELDLLRLKDSMDELGSLDGFVVNRAPGKYQDCIISGNQKDKHVYLNEGNVERTKSFDPPTPKGTIAIGNVTYDGELFPYREVYWTEEKCEIANIRANNSGGINDPELLAKFDGEVLRFAHIDLDYEKAEELFRQNYLFQSVPPPEPDNLVGSAKDKPPTMKITFERHEDLQAFEREIKEILTQYEGAFYSISSGEI